MNITFNTNTDGSSEILIQILNTNCIQILIRKFFLCHKNKYFIFVTLHIFIVVSDCPAVNILLLHLDCTLLK